MPAQFSIQLLPMAAAVILSAGLAAFTWRFREKRGATWLLISLLSVVAWTVIYSFQVMSLDLATKEFINNFRYPFVSLTTTAWFFFVLAYTDREEWITPRILALVFAIPVVTQVLLWTNQYHFLMRESTALVVQNEMTLLHIDFGPWFWVHAIHSYLAILIGIALFLKFTFESRTISRGQGIVLVFAVLISFVPALFDDLGYTTVDYTPVFFSVTVMLFGYVVYRKELLDVIPVARKTVVEEMRDGIIVLDQDRRIIDYNPAATYLLETDENVIGRAVTEVSSLPVPRTTEETVEETTVELDGEKRHFTMHLSPLQEGDTAAGWLLVTQDITEIKNRERELELLNRVVRHDIQNDMTVVRGYAQQANSEVEQTELIEPILRSSEHAIELTNTVRDLLNTITSDESLELDPVDLAAVLQAEIEKARATHPGARFELASEIDPNLSVEANNMLSSVFTNLFTNAVRHNDQETPEITVSVEQNGETVAISVADNGPGVPPDHKTEIFGRGEHGLDSPGTGVGLYLVDTLTEQFGGAVRVEDNEPRGAVFVVELQQAVVAADVPSGEP